MKLDITGLNKAKIFAALFNAAQPQGLGKLHFIDRKMTEKEAQRTLDEYESKRFDYHEGRVMKINFSGDVLLTDLYDRDNGQGAALAAIKFAGLEPKVIEV